MRTTLICVAIAIVAAGSAPAQTTLHEVRDGDTMYGIARRYNVSVDALLVTNEIEAPELLLPGTVLTIPNQYRVQKGDTLYSIARRYETTVAALQDLNDLSDQTIIVGDYLRVPAPAESAPGDAASTITAEDAGDSGPDPDATADQPNIEEPDATAIPVAASVVRPLSYDEGGAWPVAGRRRSLDGKFPGVMISTDRGTPVASVTSGRIVYSGPHSSFGNVVFVQSSQGYIYVYGGQESVAVTVGDEIQAGGVLGTVGVSPTEGEAALYFSVWRDNRFVDPERAPRG